RHRCRGRRTTGRRSSGTPFGFARPGAQGGDPAVGGDQAGGCPGRAEKAFRRPAADHGGGGQRVCGGGGVGGDRGRAPEPGARAPYGGGRAPRTRVEDVVDGALAVPPAARDRAGGGERGAGGQRDGAFGLVRAVLDEHLPAAVRRRAGRRDVAAQRDEHTRT